MEKKIFGILKPFSLNQEFYVYDEGGNKIEYVTCLIDNIPDMIFKLSEEYGVNKVKLVGVKNYIKGIKNNIEEKELVKYNVNKLEIEL